MAPALVSCEQVLCKRRPERAAANHDDIELTGVGASNSALFRFIQPIADVASKNVTREIGYLGLRGCCHNFLLTGGLVDPSRKIVRFKKLKTRQKRLGLGTDGKNLKKFAMWIADVRFAPGKL
jgi:hypothetical protein